MTQLEQRIAKLEALQKVNSDFAIPKQRASDKSAAAFLALRSFVFDLVIRAGASPEHVDSCWKERIKYFLDQLRTDAEGIDPGLAAEIDDRSPDEVPTSEIYQPLFPPLAE